MGNLSILKKKIERRAEFREIEIDTRKFGPASEIREG
jgi:hypothetical protein